VLLERFSIDDAYRAAHRLGSFSLKHRLRYDLRHGDPFRVHARLVARGASSPHVMTWLADAAATESCSAEEIMVHVDLTSCRSAPMPEDVAADADRVLADVRIS
jgi:acyl-CoA thioesterase FadM